MDKDSVQRAMSAGAPVTCATCVFFHEGNGFCNKVECGGPGAGRDFPSYNGPIPRDKFVERCLICGSGNTTRLIVGLPTKFALCGKHKSVYDHVGQSNPDAVKLPVVTIELP